MNRIKIEIIMMIRILLYPVIVNFRNRARHIVYNYDLENEIFNYKLLESNIDVVKNVVEVPTGVNHLKYEEIPRWKYLCYKWLVWIYLDDSCTMDTYYVTDLSNVNKIYPKYKIKHKYQDIEIGTSWSMGDARSKHNSRNRILEWLVVRDYTKMNYYYIKTYSKNRTENSIFINTVMYKGKRVDVFKRSISS